MARAIRGWPGSATGPEQIARGGRANHLIIFYPRSHCELNLIGWFWCAAKRCARENCKYLFDGLRQLVLVALESASTASINQYYGHCARAIDAYSKGIKYGIKSSLHGSTKGVARL